MGNTVDLDSARESFNQLKAILDAEFKRNETRL